MHDVVDCRYVEPARGDVRCEEYTARCGFEPVEVFEALALLELGVEWPGGEAEQGEERE